MFLLIFFFVSTAVRWQSKTLLTIHERASEIAKTSVFDCHLSPVGRLKAIENSVYNYFWSTFGDSSYVSDCRLSGVVSVYAYLFGTACA